MKLYRHWCCTVSVIGLLAAGQAEARNTPYRINEEHLPRVEVNFNVLQTLRDRRNNTVIATTELKETIAEETAIQHTPVITRSGNAPLDITRPVVAAAPVTEKQPIAVTTATASAIEEEAPKEEAILAKVSRLMKLYPTAPRTATAQRKEQDLPERESAATPAPREAYISVKEANNQTTQKTAVLTSVASQATEEENTTEAPTAPQNETASSKVQFMKIYYDAKTAPQPKAAAPAEAPIALATPRELHNPVKIVTKEVKKQPALLPPAELPQPKKDSAELIIPQSAVVTPKRKETEVRASAPVENAPKISNVPPTSPKTPERKPYVVLNETPEPEASYEVATNFKAPKTTATEKKITTTETKSKRRPGIAVQRNARGEIASQMTAQRMGIDDFSDLEGLPPVEEEKPTPVKKRKPTPRAIPSSHIYQLPKELPETNTQPKSLKLKQPVNRGDNGPLVIQRSKAIQDASKNDPYPGKPRNQGKNDNPWWDPRSYFKKEDSSMVNPEIKSRTDIPAMSAEDKEKKRVPYIVTHEKKTITPAKEHSAPKTEELLAPSTAPRTIVKGVPATRSKKVTQAENIPSKEENITPENTVAVTSETAPKKEKKSLFGFVKNFWGKNKEEKEAVETASADTLGIAAEENIISTLPATLDDDAPTTAASAEPVILPNEVNKKLALFAPAPKLKPRSLDRAEEAALKPTPKQEMDVVITPKPSTTEPKEKETVLSRLFPKKEKKTEAKKAIPKAENLIIKKTVTKEEVDIKPLIVQKVETPKAATENTLPEEKKVIAANLPEVKAPPAALTPKAPAMSTAAPKQITAERKEAKETEPSTPIAILPKELTSAPAPTTPVEKETTERAEEITEEADKDIILPSTPTETQVASLNMSSTSEEVTEATKPSARTALLPQGVVLRIFFDNASTELSTKERDQLRSFIEEKAKASNKRLKVVSYAQNTDNKTNAARRISLQRAIKIRSQMISAGLESIRINVQAAGNQFQGDSIAGDYADVYFVE